MMQAIQTGQTNLISKLGLLWSKIAPQWAQRSIDSQLFLHNNEKRKQLRLPRGVEQKVVNTPDGAINLYQIGKGPAIVLVHGWGGGAYQFFSLMRGLKECGFTAISFDHLGHEASESKPATLHQLISTTDYILNRVKNSHDEGLYSVVAHGLGCMVVANAKPALIDQLPLFFIAPIFNYKLYFLRKLSGLKLHQNLLKQYAANFVKNYDKEFARLELANKLKKYSDDLVIVHDRDDNISPIADSVKFTQKFPLARLISTREYGHNRVISSETVWHELKSHINYDDTTINFHNIVVTDGYRN